jgi:hypothetical protein
MTSINEPRDRAVKMIEEYTNEGKPATKINKRKPKKNLIGNIIYIHIT